MIRPMLAVEAPDWKLLHFPLLASPKIDGIRCLTMEGSDCRPVPMSRRMKIIPNKEIQRFFRKHNVPIGFDGEIVIPKRETFGEVSSVIMSADKPAGNWEYYIFDYVRDWEPSATERSFQERLDRLSNRFARWTSDMSVSDYRRVVILTQTLINSVEELEAYEAKCIAEGHEGAILRLPSAPYKCGRSTAKQQWMLKVKRFTDAEAVVTGYEPQYRNDNPITRDAFGLAERSSHKANKVELEKLGKLIGKNKKGQIVRVGSGFTDAERVHLWSIRETLIGKSFTYKSQLHGEKEAPRLPIFKGFRED